jgi:hypothetical protein
MSPEMATEKGKKSQGDPVFSAAPPAPLQPSIVGTAANDTPKPITQFSLLCSNCLDVTIIIVFKVLSSRAGVCTVHVNNNSKSQTPSPINIALDPPCKMVAICLSTTQNAKKKSQAANLVAKTL